MWNISNLIALPEPDDVRKIVLDDAKVIAVVVDVRGQQQSITACCYELLALVGSAPEYL